MSGYNDKSLEVCASYRKKARFQFLERIRFFLIPTAEVPVTNLRAQEIMDEYLEREHIQLRHTDKNRAFYSPSFDYINLPEIDQFNSQAEYYSTAFHEMTHSTGHADRLNRLDTGIAAAAFGSETYSKEELVAEIGAATLVNYTGLETDKSFRNSISNVYVFIRQSR